MSLVDYASSSDDDVSDAEGDRRREETQGNAREEASHTRPPPTTACNNQNLVFSSNLQQESSMLRMPTTIEKLPDASLLLNSPSTPSVSGNDHASHVAAAMAQSTLRKRDQNGIPSSGTRSKLRRGNLPHSKSIPETNGGILVPPQVKGRSNVATEDMSKLFVKKHPDPSVGASPS